MSIAHEMVTPPSKARHGFIRRLAVIVLLVLSVLLVPVTILAIYTNTQLTDTERYTNTVTPIADDPAVQAYLADTFTQRLFDKVNVDEYVRENLPKRAKVLATPIAVAMKTATHDAVLKAIQSDKFQDIWVRANERTHAALAKILTNERDGDKAVTADNSKVNLDLSVLGDKIQARLESSNIDVFSKIPADKLSGQVKLFDAKGLYQARRITSLLDKLAYVLPFVLVACLAGAAFLARNRRRGFVWCTVAVTIGVTILWAGLTVIRNIYLDQMVKQDVPKEA